MNDSRYDAMKDLIDYTRHMANFADSAMRSLEVSVETLESYLQEFDDVIE